MNFEKIRYFTPSVDIKYNIKYLLIYIYSFYADPNNMTVLNRTFQDEPLIME